MRLEYSLSGKIMAGGNTLVKILAQRHYTNLVPLSRYSSFQITSTQIKLFEGLVRANKSLNFFQIDL